MRKVRYLDLRIPDKMQRDRYLSAVERVMVHGQFINGPEVVELESRVARYCGRKFGVGVNSGTDALFLALKALGIGPGDEVITTSLSWIATANAIALTGAHPVFADIRDDLNIDPASIERLITPKTKAVVIVHFTGKMCAMDDILALVRRHRLLLVEDAAQSFGSKYKEAAAGSFGDISCFSINPMKVFAALGEAGMVLTNDPEMVTKLGILRYNGTINKEECVQIALNGRIDTIQAAILLERLEEVGPIIARRREIAAYYSKHLASLVKVPIEKNNEFDSYYTYTIRSSRRDELKAYLIDHGVEIKIQHSILMPSQPAYRSWTRSETTNAAKIVTEILCLPAHEKMTDEDMAYVKDQVIAFHREA
jgi:dTDP-4-amino-4,6-dideoxygalactose transaminase